MYSVTVRRAAAVALARGESVGAVARRLGISRAAITAWRKEGFEARKPECPVCDGASVHSKAYVALLGFYLGDGCISAAARYHALRVSCDAKYPGIIDDVEDLVRDIRPGGRVFRVRAPGAVVVQSNWVHWPCLFPQDGEGPKHRREIELTNWQRLGVTLHPADFLRGLFHSDGCRTTNVVRARRTGKSYAYARWMFSNRSEDIHFLCQWALDLVDVDWKRTGWQTCVSRGDAVARLDRLIGLKW